MKSPKAIIRTVSVAMAMILAATTVRAGDIVDTAISAGSFKTLVAAVKAADLVGTLKARALSRCSLPLMRHLPSCPLERSLLCLSQKTKRS